MDGGGVGGVEETGGQGGLPSPLTAPSAPPDLDPVAAVAGAAMVLGESAVGAYLAATSSSGVESPLGSLPVPGGAPAVCLLACSGCGMPFQRAQPLPDSLLHVLNLFHDCGKRLAGDDPASALPGLEACIAALAPYVHPENHLLVAMQSRLTSACVAAGAWEQLFAVGPALVGVLRRLHPPSSPTPGLLDVTIGKVCAVRRWAWVFFVCGGSMGSGSYPHVDISPSLAPILSTTLRARHCITSCCTVRPSLTSSVAWMTPLLCLGRSIPTQWPLVTSSQTRDWQPPLDT